MLKRLKIKAVVAVALAFGLFNAHAVGQQYPAPSERQPPKEYHESALRRFEIVTLVSLPFTAIHSYLAVRGIRMIEQNEFSPELTGKDFRIIGASAASFALFIGVWDWLHTRNQNPSQPLIPKTEEPPSRRLREPPREVGLRDWQIDDVEDNALSLPLIQVRF